MLKWKPPLRKDDPRPAGGKPIFESRRCATLCPTCDLVPATGVILPADVNTKPEPRWRSKPASDKQLAYLEILGATPGDLTRGEACDLISELLERDSLRHEREIARDFDAAVTR